jgi:hypothetical protein
MDSTMQQAIENATACANSCLASINYCSHIGGRHAESSHLGLLIDCARICSMSADYMLRESSFHGQICGICADVCDDCAKSCDQFKDDDPMRDCAAKCRSCAGTCRQMARMMKAA